MDPILNQGTTPKTVITQKTRDFNSWSDKELKLELRKFGEKVPKHTERAELIRRLNVHEKPIQTIHQGQFPQTQGINSDVVLVTEATRDYKCFSDRNLRNELKRFGERVPRNTERAELIRRLNIHEKPTHTTISTPISQGLTGTTGVPLEVPIGLPTQHVPHHFQSGIPIHHSTLPIQQQYQQLGSQQLGSQQLGSQQFSHIGLPIQQSTLPIQQQYPQLGSQQLGSQQLGSQYQLGSQQCSHIGVPLQQQRCDQQLGSQQLGSQQYQSGSQQCSHIGVPQQQRCDQQLGSQQCSHTGVPQQQFNQQLGSQQYQSGSQCSHTGIPQQQYQQTSPQQYNRTSIPQQNYHRTKKLPLHQNNSQTGINNQYY